MMISDVTACFTSGLIIIIIFCFFFTPGSKDPRVKNIIISIIIKPTRTKLQVLLLILQLYQLHYYYRYYTDFKNSKQHQKETLLLKMDRASRQKS